jgi:hypothetical protein
MALKKTSGSPTPSLLTSSTRAPHGWREGSRRRTPEAAIRRSQEFLTNRRIFAFLFVGEVYLKREKTNRLAVAFGADPGNVGTLAGVESGGGLGNDGLTVGVVLRLQQGLEQRVERSAK